LAVVEKGRVMKKDEASKSRRKGGRGASRTREGARGELDESQLEAVSGGTTECISFHFDKVELSYQPNQSDFEFAKRKA